MRTPRVVYFAYGSNMSEPRLQSRVAQARRLGVFRLDGYRLAYHKRGRDGSGKCDVQVADAAAQVYGVAFSIQEDELEVLDAIEGRGRGYQRKTVPIVAANGDELSAFTYYAIDIAGGLKPYDWYCFHVRYGALAAGLPTDYYQRYCNVNSVVDRNPLRRRRELSIYPKHELNTPTNGERDEEA